MLPTKRLPRWQPSGPEILVRFLHRARFCPKLVLDLGCRFLQPGSPPELSNSLSEFTMSDGGLELCTACLGTACDAVSRNLNILRSGRS